jgi:uroporphyrinogen-III decarboxylase
LGIERHLYAFYDQPELMHRLNADLAAWHVRVIDELCSVCTPDFMTFAEDLSYNHGPMLSRALFDEFLRPYYEQVTPRLAERGILPLVDSDGDITEAAPWFESVGVAGILPLERQAGVDVARLRATHPRMRWIGCFDKMVMSRGEAAMRAEFERLVPTAAQGGLIISCDHQTPPGVSCQDYQLYVRLFREYAEEAGRRCQVSGAR